MITMSAMRTKFSIAALATGLALMALPGVAWAGEDGADGESSTPGELVAPAGCDYSAGECPIVFEPATDNCVVSRHRVWVARDGEWTIINWTWGDSAELDAAVKAANDQFTQWIANSDIDSLFAACGFKKPAENPGDSSEQTPPPTGTPEEGDPNQTGLPPMPAECDQGSGRYVCPDGNPPYGCWAVTAPDRPSTDDSPASDGSENANGSSKSHTRMVGLCIDPIEEPPEVPINLCDWEPTSCEGPIDPPALPSCTLGEDDNPICSTVIPLTRRDGTVPPRHKSKSKPKARARTHSGRKAKLHGTNKSKATKKHAAKKSPKVAKKKQKASRR